MQFALEQALERLRETPRTLRVLLNDGEHPWANLNYGPDTFSPFDVVGHLIHGEKADWIPRARLILERGESKPFAPFDRYAMYEESRGKTLKNLLDEFTEARAQSLTALRNMRLRDGDLDRRGTHPALGPVTLGQLLATWVVHDLNHVAQVCKALAFQYRDEVGPWLAYLSILRPPNPA